MTQKVPGKLNWVPVATWGRLWTHGEVQHHPAVLELNILQEGLSKMGAFANSATQLVILVSSTTKTLLGIAKKSHPSIQAAMINLSCYKPTFMILEPGVAIPGISWVPEITPEEEWDDVVQALVDPPTVPERALTEELRRRATPRAAMFEKGAYIQI